MARRSSPGRFALNFLLPLALRMLVCVLTCLLAACAKLPAVPAWSGPSQPDPTRVSISLNAAATVNVDARGRSTPVVVRTYVLKNASVFDAADFFSLFERDQQVLGGAVVAREEVALMPGEKRTLDLAELDGGKVVAVFVAFREIDRAVWRASIPIVANRASQIVVTLQDNRVELSSSSNGLSLPSVSLPASLNKPSPPVLQVPTSISSPTLPSVSIPSPNVPSVSIPSPGMPSVSIPSPTVPSVSIPAPALPLSIPVR